MGRRRWTNVLVEGGAGVLGSFLDCDAINEVHVFIAPCLAGGAAATPAFGGRGSERIADALRLAAWSIEDGSGDCYIHGWTEEEKA
jgi:diaminohydroxyphosphoribosylaminopyrimidine deaminase/5-amino-6-(5-phosphoribosylamino)uracil reductase